MSGNKIQRTREQQLDALGEDQVFSLYVELGSVRRVVEKLFVPASPNGYDWGRSAFYRWLRQDPQRWERWREAQGDRGHVEADLVSEEAANTTNDNARAQRVKISAHQWRAERLNRAAYGPPSQQVNVGVGVQVGDDWLAALRAMADK